MNLQAHISKELWLAISSLYEGENYSGAILEAFHFLTNCLREKAGIDGDGVPLVGNALGGSAPRLRVNKLQTDTERDVQKGMESLLRGMYQAYRNPRSHEHFDDSRSTADAVIFFIDHLLGILTQARQPFAISDLLDQVFDPAFVGDQRYGAALAAEIPAAKRLDAAIAIYRSKSRGSPHKLPFAVKPMLEQLSDDQRVLFLNVVADELRTTKDEVDIRMTLALLPPSWWPQIGDVARLRTENWLISALEHAKCTAPTHDRCNAEGALGTWARDFVVHFTYIERVRKALLSKLEGPDDERAYVTAHFLRVLPELYKRPFEVSRCVSAISKAVRSEVQRGWADDSAVRRHLVDSIWSLPASWQTAFVTSLQDVTCAACPETWLSDGTPFLKGEQAYEVENDETGHYEWVESVDLDVEPPRYDLIDTLGPDYEPPPPDEDEEREPIGDEEPMESEMNQF